MTTPQEVLALTQRQRWMVRMLLTALEDPHPPRDWPTLCVLAVQYGGRAVERPSAAEFDALRHLTLGQLLGMDPVWQRPP